MNKSRTGAKVLALMLGATLLAAACGDDDDNAGGGADTTGAVAAETTAPSDTSGGDTSAADTSAPDTTADSGAPVEGGTFTYMHEQELDAYNVLTADTNATKNAIVANQTLPDVFQFDETGDLFLDEDLMESAEITSEDPQVITYVVNPDAVWSDGEPIDCDDFQLAWVAQNGVYKQKNPDGTVATDDSGGELTLFTPAGTAGSDQIESLECSEDGKTITTTYSSPFSDWKGLFGALLPAHILEAETGVADIGAAIEAQDEAALAKAAEFWNTGWVLTPGDLKPELTPSGDRYLWDTWEPGAQITLIRNPNYWAEPGASESVVIRFIAQDAQAQALQNGEGNAMDPQPNPELKQQLEQMSGVVVTTGEQYTYEHTDFNFTRPDMQIKEVREAFAKCLPRQLIVDNLIKPQNPEAIILNSRMTFPFEDRYTDASGGAYDTQDIEGAKALLDAAGKSGMPLQLNSNGNPRRINEIALIKDSCDQAGFVVEDLSDPTFFDADGGLAEKDFDIALYAFTGSPLLTPNADIFGTGKGNNNGAYSNPEVDELFVQLNGTLDEAEQVNLVTQIETILWDDLATIPVFAFPSIEAHVENSDGVIFNPTSAGLTWNAHQWVLTE